MTGLQYEEMLTCLSRAAEGCALAIKRRHGPLREHPDRDSVTDAITYAEANLRRVREIIEEKS